MVRRYKYKENPYNLTKCELLGKGNNGAVYLLPNGNVIKMFFCERDFVGEFSILEKVNGSKYFPRIYEIGTNYIIRECVEGEILTSYIMKNGLDRSMGRKIIEMLKKFEKMHFKKIDLRCRDIFVQPDGNLKVIDPKNFYTKNRNFPRHLCKGLYNLGVLEAFLEILKHEDSHLYKKWKPKIDKYIVDRYELNQKILD